MTRVIVSEKALEINVTAELISVIRAKPGCANAFWIGMKQRQEARNGIDGLISKVPRGVPLALQFKSPRSTPRNGNPFVFSLGEPQYTHLCRLAAVRPTAVHYVLPHLDTFQAVRMVAPVLLQQTFGVAVTDSAWLPPGRHRIESGNTGVSIFSESTPIEIRPIRKVVQFEPGSCAKKPSFRTRCSKAGWRRCSPESRGMLMQSGSGSEVFLRCAYQREATRRLMALVGHV
jgi:hypothetical protein